jgi:protein-S-isoprenylcysteine O-methyltransferase Ste14
MAAIVVTLALFPWPHPLPTAIVVAGLALAALGLALVLWARVTLGGAFTMFPEPKRRDALVSSGPYGYARHPMYGGLLLLLGGVSLARSIPALVLTAALAVLWWRKSVVEERRLTAAYPDYPAYRQRVRRRFVPFVA